MQQHEGLYGKQQCGELPQCGRLQNGWGVNDSQCHCWCSTLWAPKSFSHIWRSSPNSREAQIIYYGVYFLKKGCRQHLPKIALFLIGCLCCWRVWGNLVSGKPLGGEFRNEKKAWNLATGQIWSVLGMSVSLRNWSVSFSFLQVSQLGGGVVSATRAPDSVLFCRHHFVSPALQNLSSPWLITFILKFHPLPHTDNRVNLMI